MTSLRWYLDYSDCFSSQKCYFNLRADLQDKFNKKAFIQITTSNKKLVILFHLKLPFYLDRLNFLEMNKSIDSLTRPAA